MESGIGDFLQQIPAPLIGISCLSALVLVSVIAYIMWTRSKKRQLALAGVPLSAVSAASAMSLSQSVDRPPAADLADLSDVDLPDLDVLTAPASSARPTGTYRIKMSEGDSLEVVEVLAVLRDVGEGGLLVQIGDKVYRNPPATADAEFKRRFNSTMKELATGKRVTETTAAAPDAPPMMSSPPPSPAPAAAPDAPPMPPPITTRTGEVPAVNAPKTVPLPGDLPKFKMPDQPEVPPRRGRKLVHQPIPEINIAAAIESYLQHKLSLSPEWAGRNIHVRSAAHGGVEIDVDGKVYESVSDIEDASVRAFIASTIEEWQSRQ